MDSTQNTNSDLSKLRKMAIAQTLFPPTDLQDAMNRLGFVQADPIRSPARAQDLILRHRVHEYRQGDLHQAYPNLNLEEDFLYAHGFMRRDIWQSLYPRPLDDPTEFELRVLEVVREMGPVDSKDLDVHFGRERVLNAWGGQSKASKRAMESLHRHGLLRVARRKKGIRLYEVVGSKPAEASPDLRFRDITMTITSLLSPAPKKRLKSILAPVARYILGRDLGSTAGRAAIDYLLKSGDLIEETFDGVSYVRLPSSTDPAEERQQVRFLAPFDPLIWDRWRFEHLWGWPYRFEAYTPPAKRVRGYYAMPLMWGEEVIGWANLDNKKGELSVEIGFVEKRPDSQSFESELETEIERMRYFLDAVSTVSPA